MSILERIGGHEDLLKLNDEDRKVLCQEIREYLVSHVAKTGGHLASNLGVVELSVALETVFDTKKDRLVFDVGHQSYIHKLLTGRQADFDNLRQFGGIAGFPKPGESDTDAFVAGHASSSVSIALGMARARTLSCEDYKVVALIGDGATTGGLAYEGLNDAGDSREPLIVVLNDNEMSIDHNVGGMAKHLSRLRVMEGYLGMKKRFRRFTSKIPGGDFIFRVSRSVKDFIKRRLLESNVFEQMGFAYLGPVDGHDVRKLIFMLNTALNLNRPVLIHVMTQKGHGYLPAEEHPSKFHGIGKFNPLTGEPLKKGGPTFSEAFGKTMIALAQEDTRVCAITAAMPGGTGLLEFKKQFPKRIFDVGIAEEHAVSMAGGLAKQGMIPVVAIYSTFLQRSYDQIFQDVALLKLHVVFAADRAGRVGEDGETHHGVFDVGFLRQVPGMTVLCPASMSELQGMLIWAVEDCAGPVAIRYPRGGNRGYTDSAWSLEPGLLTDGALSKLADGEDVTLLTYGTMMENVMTAAALLEAQGIHAQVLRLLMVKPLPVEQILDHMGEISHLIIVEEVCAGSGIREALAYELRSRRPELDVRGIDLGHRFVTHGDMESLYRSCGLDGASIANYAREVIGK